MEHFHCSVCQQEQPKHEQYNVEGQQLCANCASWLTTNCSECGDRILKASNKGDIDEPLCSTCWGKIVRGGRR